MEPKGPAVTQPDYLSILAGRCRASFLLRGNHLADEPRYQKFKLHCRLSPVVGLVAIPIPVYFDTLSFFAWNMWCEQSGHKQTLAEPDEAYTFRTQRLMRHISLSWMQESELIWGARCVQQLSPFCLQWDLMSSRWACRDLQYIQHMDALVRTSPIELNASGFVCKVK